MSPATRASLLCSNCPHLRRSPSVYFQTGGPSPTAVWCIRFRTPTLSPRTSPTHPASRTFFISSVHKRKILAIHPDGTIIDFLSSGDGGIWAIFALAVDPKRHLLWATTAAVPEGLGFEKADGGKTALLCYDLATRKLVKRYDLPTDAAPHALGDMTLSLAGDVYVSDGYGSVYSLRSGGSALEALNKPGDFRSPQTPALTPDGTDLLVADYSLGIGVIDLKTKALSWLPRAKDIALEGTDGLYLRGRSLFAIQNGIDPARIVRVDLDRDLTRAEHFSVLEQASPSLGDPTHGVIVDNSFYFIGNSGWNRMSDSGQLTPGISTDCPVVMQMKLESGPLTYELVVAVLITGGGCPKFAQPRPRNTTRSQLRSVRCIVLKRRAALGWDPGQCDCAPLLFRGTDRVLHIDFHRPHLSHLSLAKSSGLAKRCRVFADPLSQRYIVRVRDCRFPGTNCPVVSFGSITKAVAAQLGWPPRCVACRVWLTPSRPKRFS